MKLRYDIREHDAIVQVGGAKYHFVKDRRGVLHADVAEDHAETLLASNEGFSVYEQAAEDAAVESGNPVPGKQVPDDEEDDPEFGAPIDDKGPVAGVYENKTMEELRDIYHERFGKAAPPLMKHETMLERLVRDDAQRGKA